MSRTLSAAERLIVAADFTPHEGMLVGTPQGWVRDEVLSLAEQLKGTGVCLKLNSALRACGYDLILEIKEKYGLRVFADLKLNDIPNTLATDGRMLLGSQPRLLTVMCSTGIESMKKLKETAPPLTEVLGVTVLTSIKDDDPVLGGLSIRAWVIRYAEMALKAGIDGLIASPKELAILRRYRRYDQLSITTPGIRPSWAAVRGDDQNADRVMTPGDAIRAGADRIVVGRPITQSDDPGVAVLRTLEEIDFALAPA